MGSKRRRELRVRQSEWGAVRLGNGDAAANLGGTAGSEWKCANIQLSSLQDESFLLLDCLTIRQTP